MIKNWYERPVSVFCCLLICLLICISAMQNLKLGPGGKSNKNVIAVIIRHYGIDSAEMERSITRPLEDSLSILPRLLEIKSTSEYGMSRIELTLDDDSSESYLFTRDTVDRFYATLPKSVQKPQIVSSSSNQKPVFILAFEPGKTGLAELRDYVENQIKPAFQNLTGVGEVEIGGGELKEIHVLVDSDKTTGAGVNFDGIASILQASHIQYPLGKIPEGTNDLPVLLKGELQNLEQIRDLRIPLANGNTVMIRDFADVKYGYRQQDSVSRVDGDQKVVLYIKTSGSANIIQVSRQARAETERWKNKGFDCQIIIDNGSEIEKSIMAVFQAIIIGILIVCIVLAPFQNSIINSILLSLTLPVITLITLAVLSAASISIDRFILAGIAVCIGMVIDSGIVISEQINLRSMKIGLKEIASPLLASTLSTVIVLLPLFFLDKQIEGVSQISLAILLIVSLSVVFNLIFLPAFLNKTGQKKQHTKTRFRLLNKKLMNIISLFASKPLYGIILGIGMATAGALLLILLDKNISVDVEPNIIRAHIEYESGASAESVDKRTRTFTEALKNIKGIKRIESHARRDNCQLTIICNENIRDISEVRDQVKGLENYISGGFLYLPGTGSNELLNISIELSGNENEVLRDLANKTVETLSNEPWVHQGVLHFKDPPAIYNYVVHQKKSIMSGISASLVSSTMRWALQGPVAIKWHGEGREMDLRIMGKNNTSYTIKDLYELSIPSNEGEHNRLYYEGEFKLSHQEAKIYRTNRQRSVSLSIQVPNNDIFETYGKLNVILNKIELPEGYAFSVDKSILENKKYFRQLYAILGLAVMIIYMLLAAQTESLTFPLQVLSIVPVSLTFPLIALWLTGKALTLPAIIGLIILTGMIVNNSILIIDNFQLLNKRRNENKNDSRKDNVLKISLAVKQRLRPLFLTSLTTIAGTIPMFFLRSSGTALLSDLALIMFTGILGSFLMTISFIPAVLTLTHNTRKSQ